MPLSYAVAISYVLVDTIDKGFLAYKQAKHQLGSSQLDPSVDAAKLTRLLAAERAMDCLIWQLLASVAIPGYTIHTIVHYAHEAIALALGGNGVESLSESATGAVNGLAATLTLSPELTLALIDKSLPTMVGLAAIPFIVHPIDNAVHWMMNKTLRPVVRKYICVNGGAAAGLDICNETCAVPSEQ